MTKAEYVKMVFVQYWILLIYCPHEYIVAQAICRKSENRNTAKIPGEFSYPLPLLYYSGDISLCIRPKAKGFSSFNLWMRAFVGASYCEQRQASQPAIR